MPRRSLLPLALVLILAACSSGSPDTSDASAESSVPPSAAASEEPEAQPPVAGTSLNACEIVTGADIESALALDAGTVADGELQETPNTLSPGHTDCSYSGDWGGLKVSLTPEDGANLYDAARGAYDDASDRELVGTEGAFWSQGTSRGFAWKGAVAVMLQFSFITVDADWDDATTALAQAAMDRVD